MNRQLNLIFEDISTKLPNKTFMDFCSGIGGGRQAAEQNGFTCIGFSEIDIDAEKTYRAFYQAQERNFGDIMSIVPEELPNFDLMVAGFPCQTFSINGKREGFEDERGLIIHGLIEILKTKSVPYFVLENVKGLVNHDQGRTLKIILELLDNAGYDVFHKILISNDFGSPQIRERIYLVGARKELKLNYQFPEPQSAVINLSDFLDCEEKFEPNETFFKYLNNKYNQGKYSLEDILQMDDCFVDTRQSDIRFFEHCPTLRANRQGILYVKNHKLYRLSPSESLKLQGFTQKQADISKSFSRAAIYKQAGNAMNINTMSAIIRNLNG